MNIRKAIYPKIGMKFGFLTVISSLETKKKGLYFWKCRCQCGTKILVWNHNLFNGNTKACRCMTKKKIKERSTTHGMSKTRPWNIWIDMHRRCKDKKNKSYLRYGGRGIKVDPTWNNFTNFWKDMGPSYKVNFQIDRINNNGNYCKTNCHWVTVLEQANNKRNNRIITYNKETKTLAMWCRKLNLNYSRTLGRLNLGYSVDDAFIPKKQKTGKKYN